MPLRQKGYKEMELLSTSCVIFFFVSIYGADAVDKLFAYSIK